MPQERVSPDPRSCTRNATWPGPRRVTNSMLTPCGYVPGSYVGSDSRVPASSSDSTKATAWGLPMSTWVAGQDRSPTATLLSPSTRGLPMSAVMVPSSSKVRVLMPSRVPTGTGTVGSTRPSSARCRPNTRMPLPHISDTEPSLLR